MPKPKLNKSTAVKKTVISQHIDTQMLAALDRQAEKRGLSRTAFINLILYDALSNMNDVYGEFDPMTCSIEELERAIGAEKNERILGRMEGVRHARISFVRPLAAR
jgi:hypothetical protein